MVKTSQFDSDTFAVRIMIQFELRDASWSWSLEALWELEIVSLCSFLPSPQPDLHSHEHEDCSQWHSKENSSYDCTRQQTSQVESVRFVKGSLSFTSDSQKHVTSAQSRDRIESVHRVEEILCLDPHRRIFVPCNVHKEEHVSGRTVRSNWTERSWEKDCLSKENWITWCVHCLPVLEVVVCCSWLGNC